MEKFLETALHLLLRNWAVSTVRARPPPTLGGTLGASTRSARSRALRYALRATRHACPTHAIGDRPAAPIRSGLPCKAMKRGLRSGKGMRRRSALKTVLRNRLFPAHTKVARVNARPPRGRHNSHRGEHHRGQYNLIIEDAGAEVNRGNLTISLKPERGQEDPRIASACRRPVRQVRFRCWAGPAPHAQERPGRCTKALLVFPGLHAHAEGVACCPRASRASSTSGLIW